MPETIINTKSLAVAEPNRNWGRWYFYYLLVNKGLTPDK